MAVLPVDRRKNHFIPIPSHPSTSPFIFAGTKGCDFCVFSYLLNLFANTSADGWVSVRFFPG